MNDDAAREADRRLRAEIDPLVGGLTPLGKFELATRLALEGARGYVLESNRALPPAPRAIEAHVGSPEEDPTS